MTTRVFFVDVENEEETSLVHPYQTRLVIGNNSKLYTVLRLAFYEGEQLRGDLSLDFTSLVFGTFVKVNRPEVHSILEPITPAHAPQPNLNICQYKLILTYENLCAKSPSVSRNSKFRRLNNHLEAEKPLYVGVHLSRSDLVNLDAALSRIQVQSTDSPPDDFSGERIRSYDACTVRQLTRTSEALKNPIDQEALKKFECFDHYLTTMAMAAQSENAVKEGKIRRYCERKRLMVVMEMAGCDNRRYQIFMPPVNNDETNIQPGDKIKVLFPGQSDLSEAWTIVALPPLTNTPEGYLSGFMCRPWAYKPGYKDEDCYDKFKLPSIISATEKAPIDRIIEEKGIEVRVSVEAYDTLSARRFLCMQYMANGIFDDAITNEVAKTLTNYSTSNIRSFDIFRNLRAEFGGHPEALITGVNPEQLSVVRSFSSAPAGIVSVEGPPGTGKTYLIIKASIPFLLSKQHLRILSTTQTNVGTDNLAILYQNCIHELIASNPDKPWLKNKYVVRAHINDTEMAIYSKKARDMKGLPKRPADYRGPSEAQKEMLKTLEIAHIIASELEEEHSSAGVDDKRAREIGLSVGMRMLQMASIISTGPKPENSRDFKSFRDGYLKWAKRVNMDKKEEEEFWHSARRLRDYVLKEAAVVCTTITNASSDSVCQNLADSVELIIADEMPRCLEVDSLLLLMGRFNPSGFIMVGDTNQLGPHVESAQGRGELEPLRTTNHKGEKIEFNPFQAQLRMSIQERLHANGFPFMMLKEQYRMDPALSKDTSRVVYESQLRDHESTVDRPLTTQLKAFNEEKFGVHTNKLLLDTRAIDRGRVAETRQASNNSRYNEYHIMFIVNLAVELTRRFPKATIAVLTGYQAQYHLLASARQRMVIQKGPHENISIHKIDTVQGLEFDIVILDQLLLKRGSPGFMRDKGRLNVATSRARHAMYILADVKAYEKIRQKEKDNTWVFKFMRVWQEFTTKLVDKDISCPYYRRGQADVKTGKTVDIEFATGW